MILFQLLVRAAVAITPIYYRQQRVCAFFFWAGLFFSVFTCFGFMLECWDAYGCWLFFFSFQSTQVAFAGSSAWAHDLSFIFYCCCKVQQYIWSGMPALSLTTGCCLASRLPLNIFFVFFFRLIFLFESPKHFSPFAVFTYKQGDVCEYHQCGYLTSNRLA